MKTIDGDQLDPNSVLPLYFQLKEILVEGIRAGEFNEGDMLPSEPTLQKQFGVSRATVRKCFDELTSDGLIEKKRGKGTFVKRLFYEESLSELLSFTEKTKGVDAKKKVIKAKKIIPSRDVAKKLKLSDNERVLYLQRLMIVDGISIGVREEYIPEKLGFSLDEDYSKSVYQLFQKNNILLKEADQTIGASLSTKEEMALVGLRQVFPILVINRLVYSISDEPVEYLRVFFNAKYFRYKLKLSRYES